MPPIGLRLILAAVGLFSIVPRSTAAELDAPYAQSMSAFMRHDLAGAERAAREVVAHDSSASHRLESALMLGAIEWRVRRDTTAASRWLTEAAAMPNGRSRAFAERARMLTTMARPSAAAAAARTALAAAADASQRRTALVQLASATVEPRLSARLAATPHARAPSEMNDLHPLIEQLSAEVRENPGELDPAALLVTLGALANDGPAILLGWNSYYLVGATGATSALLASPRRVLEERLPRWNPQSAEDRTAVAAALADSRFFSAAAIVATGAPLDARMRDIVAYARFARSVERAADDYYRATALGRGNAKEWKRALDARTRILWRDLAWPAAPPPFVEDTAEAELDRRFGAVINLGSTAGYEDLHMGHRVIDERRTVRQYGHEAVVRVVALDAMVSNGFQSWAWDGRAAHGGWGGGESITQVRPSYARGPLRAWREVSDSAKQRELRAAEQSDSITDVASARTTPVAYFPGLASRLDMQGQHEILDSLRASGLSGPALKGAFVGEYDRAIRESSIFAHEGRHVIDGALGKFSDEELEFRAKLSEVAFAPNPRLAMDAIMSGDIGDETPHGRANKRVLSGVLGWMTAHIDEIQGLSASLPTLPQMTLMTDAQMRTAFASLDPLAGPH